LGLDLGVQKLNARLMVYNRKVIVKKNVCILLVLFSSYSNAGIRVSAEAGEGRVDFSDAPTYETNFSGKGGFALASYIGYETDEMFIFDVGLGVLTNLSHFGFGDMVDFSTVEVLIGYRINYNKVYIEPKVGYSKWELTIKEGVFTSSDEQRKYQDSGHDPMVMLTAGYMFGSHFGISLSYKYQDYSHGDAQSTLLGFDFKF
jgi:hypothetical protein